jgi:quinohemoprotein ethanol dehydrogenase
MIRTRALGIGLLLSAVVAGCAMHERAPSASSAPAASAANVTAERLVNAAAEPDQWLTYGGTYSEQRFSALTQIDASNVSRLGLAWFADYETNQNQQGSPLYIDGVIYVSTARDVVYAFDARTGTQLWKYNPIIHGERLRYNLGLVNRGIAAWHGKIIMGTLDARLVAIDAKTGKEVWSTDTVPESLGLGEMSNRYSITMAARVAKGKVFIGASGGEYGVRGWIAAYDADTGQQVWRFWTVPGDPAKGFESAALERAAKTWNGEWWKDGGGGTVWDSVIYDPETDLLYVGTGNATPWNGHLRDPKMGDDLYTASIVALNPDTGKYVWHYQETPADTWDYDAVSPMMTADLTIGGEKKHVILQPSKNGFFYVLEAATGKLISADPFTEVNWSTGVDMKTGRPIVVPAARYVKQPWDLAPGVQGGHSWHPNAFSPQTGLVYIPAWEAYFTMAGLPPGSRQAARGGFSLGISMGARMPPGTTLQPYDRRGVRGRLEAWDPVARKIVWETEPFGAGLPTSGVLATAGSLVFMGDGSGKVLSAYDARTGAKLWSFDAQTAVFAAPITYQLDGVQYVAASVGGTAQGGYFAPTDARMLVFALGGKAVLPKPEPYTPPKLDPPPSTASAEAIAHGGELYSQYCSVCHGANGMQARTSFPNLTVTPLLWTQAGFDAVVLQGVRADKGMGSFARDLKPEDTVAVRDYLISQANVLKTRGPAAFGPFFPRQETGHADN